MGSVLKDLLIQLLDSCRLFLRFIFFKTHFSVPFPSACPRPDIQKKQPGEDCPSKPIQSSGSSHSAVLGSETSSSGSQSLLTPSPSSSEQPSAEEPSPTFSNTREGELGQEWVGLRGHRDQKFQKRQHEHTSGCWATLQPGVLTVTPRLTPHFLSTGAASTETAQGTLCTPTKRPRDSGTVLLHLPRPPLLGIPS